MRVAIFGGSFDPPHNGHRAIIEEVLTLPIDLLIILVAYQNPLKSHYRVSASKRFFWMQTLCDCYEKTLCSDYEIQRNSVTTTIQSVRYFQNLYDIETLYFVLGQDNFLQVPRWSDFEALRLALSFVVIERDSQMGKIGQVEQSCRQFAKKYMLSMQYLSFSYPYSSSLILEDMGRYQNEIPEIIRNDVVETYSKLNLTKGWK